MNSKQRVLASFAVTAVTLAAATPLLDWGYRRHFPHTIERFREIAYGTGKYDMVFLGASRVHSGIDPAVVDSELGIRSYNLGMDGATLYESRLVFEAFLENHPFPELVVLNLDLGSFEAGRKLFDSIPYFHFLGNKRIQSALVEWDYAPSYALWLPFLSYSLSDDFTRSGIFKGFVGKTELEPGEKGYEGYLCPSPSVAYHAVPQRSIERVVFDPKAPDELAAIVDRVKKAGKKIVLTYSPEYLNRGKARYSNADEVMSAFEREARRNAVPLLRYDKEPISTVQDYFRNDTHLDYAGVRIYSKLLATDLRKWVAGDFTGNRAQASTK